VFADCPVSIDDSFGLNSIPAWDSVGQLNVIMALESEFGVEFEADEFGDLTTVAAIRSRLAREA